MNPFKIKLKDHHADDERFACVKTIVEHYDISIKDAKIIMDKHWYLHETFADMLIANLNAIYKKKVANTATLHSFDNMCTNMQYYMEYCKTNEYVTPMEWIANHKHY